MITAMWCVVIALFAASLSIVVGRVVYSRRNKRVGFLLSLIAEQPSHVKKIPYNWENEQSTMQCKWERKGMDTENKTLDIDEFTEGLFAIWQKSIELNHPGLIKEKEAENG